MLVEILETLKPLVETVLIGLVGEDWPKSRGARILVGVVLFAILFFSIATLVVVLLRYLFE
jgi:hypothetical protein